MMKLGRKGLVEVASEAMLKALGSITVQLFKKLFSTRPKRSFIILIIQKWLNQGNFFYKALII